MAKTKKAKATLGEGKSNNTQAAVNDVLDLLMGYNAAEQNEIMTGVISELRISRLELVKTSQDQLHSSQSAIAALDQAVQSGLQAIPPPPAN